jgi:hypothetical protein
MTEDERRSWLQTFFISSLAAHTWYASLCFIVMGVALIIYGTHTRANP